MRQDHDKFVDKNVKIIALGPDGPRAFKRYWEENELPFTGCPDIKSKVAEQYSQEVNLFKLGRMPALFLIDKEGVIRYVHYGDDMSDIPSNDEVLEKIDEIRIG